MRVTVLYGSVRHHRQGIRAARWIVDAFEERGHEVYLVDPKEQALPMLDRMYKEYESGQAPRTMEHIAEQLRTADAFVIVSGEYNHGVPPAMKNLLDHFQTEYFWRPAAIVTYSAGHGAGTHSQFALRAILGELGMVTLPTMVGVARISDALGEGGEDRTEHLSKALGRLADELEWYARALRSARASGVPYGDPRAGRREER